MQIRLARWDESHSIYNIYLEAKQKLETAGIDQWDEYYPKLEIIQNDIENKFLYVLTEVETIFGAINISEIQESVYHTVDWKLKDGRALVVHRLVISPHHRGAGMGKQLMDFAEEYARINNYKSIRLDVYSMNKVAISMYKRRGYEIRGSISFPRRVHPFFCMEKEIL